MPRKPLCCLSFVALAWACADDGGPSREPDAPPGEAGLIDAAADQATPDAALDTSLPDAARDASSPPDAAADAGPSTLTCAEVFACAMACDPDRADCARACLNQASPEAPALALALAECTIAADSRGVDHRELCAAEFEACTGPDGD